jgi:hypothetical protein
MVAAALSLQAEQYDSIASCDVRVQQRPKRKFGLAIIALLFSLASAAIDIMLVVHTTLIFSL